MRKLVAIIAVILAGPTLVGCGATGTSATPDRTITRAPSAPVSPPNSAPAPDTSPIFPPASTLPVPPVSGAGINGITVVDGCPIVRNPPCPDKPIAAHLTITKPDGTAVATTDSGTDGRFVIALTPGDYVVRPASGSGGRPRAPAPMTVHVETDHYTAVTLRFDSGMR